MSFYRDVLVGEILVLPRVCKDDNFYEHCLLKLRITRLSS